jgi:hypothetical protein
MRFCIPVRNRKVLKFAGNPEHQIPKIRKMSTSNAVIAFASGGRFYSASMMPASTFHVEAFCIFLFFQQEKSYKGMTAVFLLDGWKVRLEEALSFLGKQAQH